jgi:acetyl-CoA C-acetyltransferase
MAQTAVPVLVGVAQVEQRIKDDPREGKEPLALMIDAVHAAAADTSNPDVLREASSVRVIRGVWPYKNPAAVVANAIDRPRAETVLTPYGGNFVQSVLNQSALDIQAGRHDVIVMTGAECGYSQARARKKGVELAWQAAAGTPDRLIGEDKDMRHPAEKKAGLGMPIQIYPMFENALRHARGESVEAHLARISALWARFSEVAATNPHAWIRRAHSAEEIRTLGPDNRPVSFPYPKLMNSNNNVDQGAALILCSTDAARRLRIPESRWIYPWAGTDAHDHYYVSNRADLHSSPAIRIAGRRCLELAGVDTGALDLVDVYSCFPVAVEVAAAEIGLPETRPLTITGGLTFAGGPLNNYVMHSIARMVELLRERPQARGLITANGGYLTKHAFGVYSAMPPTRAYRHADVQAEVDATPQRAALESYDGAVTIETYTVMFGAEGPQVGHVAALTPSGARAWGRMTDAAVLDAMTREEFCGRRGRLEAGGSISL